MAKDPKDSKSVHPPYSLSIKGASEYFNLTPQNFYDLMYQGWLRRGIHYLNIGRKPLIIREAFIEFFETEDGKMWTANQQAKGRNSVETLNRG